MTSITALKKQLSQLEEQKVDILNKVSTTARKNADARKYALGGALLKLATTDPQASSVLKKVWATGQRDKPRAFEDAEMPSLTTAPQQSNKPV